MPRTTVRFTDDDEPLYHRLDEVADDRDRSVNWLIVDAVRQVYGESDDASHHSDAPRVDAERIATLEQRLATVEESVMRLIANGAGAPERRESPETASGEERDENLAHNARASRAADEREERSAIDDADDAGKVAEASMPATGDETRDTSVGRAPGTPAESADNGVEEAITAALADWKPGKAPGDDREERRAAGRAAVEFLRERGTASASDFREELRPEHAIGDESASAWWRRVARPAINLAADADLAEFDGAREWRWIGE